MPRLFHRILLLTVLLTAVATPALARLVIGVTPAVLPGAADPALQNAFETELAARTGEPVTVRTFDSQAGMLDWLIRFRELDAALVAPGLMRTLPAGTLLPLADFPQATAVTYPGLPASRQELLSRALRSFLADEHGRQLVHRLPGGANAPASPKVTPTPSVVKPSAPAAVKPAGQPAVTVRPAVTPPAPVVKPAPAVGPQPSAKPMAPAPALKAPASQPQAPAARSPAAPAPARPAAETPTGSSSGLKRSYLLLIAALVILAGIGVKIALLMRHWRKRSNRPSAPPEPPAAEHFDGGAGRQPVPTVAVEPAPQPVAQPAPAQAPTPAITPAAPAPAAATAAPEPEPVIRVPRTGAGEAAQPVVLRVDTAGKRAVKFDFRAPASAPRPAEPAAPSVAAAATSPPAASPAPKKRPAARRPTAEEIFPPVDEASVVEQGRLGRVKVPALLKRCAELSQPVLLRVRTGDNETCVHFAAGQICHAVSRNWRVDEGARQWNKLGYLMARDGLISEAQRDQALELIERQPGLRFAAALQQLGALDPDALQHVLARQAKTTIYALILFSSGGYRIEADGSTIPAEEHIALQVDALLREASQHQAEWTAIRKALPNHGTQLDFTADGREKLEQVRLSVHQQLLLSQVDGRTSIGTLCGDSTMMDYEACRFLYLMVKAGVLQVAPAV